ncbi:hypothetical protein EVAR_47478_1 [Eumeta japonica]|uniref:Uncharacterized protein n=1 Tax=Eumeta variegata TaxID=151549 RepID=A0A4C1XCC6_EUMVA|nr:hypothetical protein EVAR_47478_1 [Eumeta japonica]
MCPKSEIKGDRRRGAGRGGGGGRAVRRRSSRRVNVCREDFMSASFWRNVFRITPAGTALPAPSSPRLDFSYALRRDSVNV